MNTYDGIGATEHGPLPTGYNHLRYRADVGAEVVFAVAAEAVLTWRMHRRAGVGMRTDAERAAPGVRVTTTVGLGPLRVSAPCQIVWAADEKNRAGFGYGTLPGHPVRGEEAFEVVIADGRTWFTATAFSKPATWFVAAAGPVVPVLQKAYVRRLGGVLARLAASGGGAG